MANLLTSNPWQLDGSSLNTILVNHDVKVSHFEFAGYTAAGTSSSVVLADRFGNVIWRATGTSDQQEVRSAKVGWVHGLQELTHTSGFVLVYFE